MRNHQILTFPKRCAAKFHAERTHRCSEISHMEAICAKEHFLEMHGRSRDTTTTQNFLRRPDPDLDARRYEMTPCGETPHSDICKGKPVTLT